MGHMPNTQGAKARLSDVMRSFLKKKKKENSEKKKMMSSLKQARARDPEWLRPRDTCSDPSHPQRDLLWPVTPWVRVK